MKKLSHLILILAISACAHLSDPKYFFKIEPEVGQIEHSSIEIERETLLIEGGELSHQAIRKLNLKIATRVVDVQNGDFWIENTTYEKEGQEYLHALGYPELHEKMLLKMNSLGRVLDVKGYDAGSLFYVPPVFLPMSGVRINDRWEDTFQWKTEGQPFEMKTKIMCRLIGIEDWNEVEVYRVSLESVSTFVKPLKDVSYESRSQGYYLWDPQKSTVLFSESKAVDELKFLAQDRVSKTLTKFTSRYLFEDENAKDLKTKAEE